MFCKKCGITVADGAAFCPECGAKIDGVPGVQNRTDMPKAEVVNTPLQQNRPVWQAAPSYTAPVYAGANKSVASCAWFGALSSAIVSFVSYFANRFVSSTVFDITYNVFNNMTVATVLNFVLLGTLEALYFLACLGMFYAATSKVEKDTRKKAAVAAVIPLFFTAFIGNLNTYVNIWWLSVGVFTLIKGVFAFAFSWLFSYIALKRFDTNKTR